jgi:hypothetical protein
MAYSDMIISFAILAAALAGNDMGVAVTEFRRFCNQVGVNAPKNARQFIQMWAGRHNKKGEIDRRSRHSGRHEKLTSKMVDTAYKGITGWAEAGRKQPYKSERDIERKCPEVRQVLQDSGATINTLMQRLKEKYPKLQYKEIKTKWVLTDENKLVRYWVCQELLASFKDLLQRVVFVDAKTVMMCEGTIRGWVDTSLPNYCEGLKPAMYKSKIIRLKYYAAVHATLGPVFIKFYTGTTGMPAQRGNKHYKVGSGNKHARLPLGFHMSHSLFQLGTPYRSEVFGSFHLLPHTQPQHTPTLCNRLVSIQAILCLPFSQAAVSVVALGD